MRRAIGFDEVISVFTVGLAHMMVLGRAKPYTKVHYPNGFETRLHLGRSLTSVAPRFQWEGTLLIALGEEDEGREFLQRVFETATTTTIG